jgi:5-formyltetrahydrofolate cyclo-ligase
MSEPAPDRTLLTAKRKLREAMQAKRMQLPHAAMLRASEAVALHFTDHPILSFAPSVAGYMAMRGEIDLKALFAATVRFHKITALPCVTEQKTLQFRRWTEGNPLARHTLGMLEPESTAPVLIPSIILVPLLAFDGDGYRLGYGSGYYDRTMAAMRRFEHPPLFVGVAYSMQEVDQVPTDSHDLPLDGILTELGVSMFR